ncbi:efflux RND transporter permease subunit [Gluconacetobacter diazotrophicus]|uniref:Putative heavy metal efflux protein n=1 Tax=Gluconacetobacter diazotrophicus (strain ATCC 49037 / DSM 5601 / CCUG 37298 / CIP 103539 / LMG 7603 / PAl5) TaxID=272568 RepID=A9HD51_GLUDA|nr:efflux RND transporter permease subunit [Gluconacetobacter diazotrophicus]CAP55052.1 putative heavy metal efflux protein [Gluconacetobacter diazotrophicus PA1 5]
MSGFNLSALAVRERGITLFLIVALALSGAYAFFSLGRAEDPPFTVKTLTATAVWPGATAQEMQDLVADPLEKRVQELQWYDRVETLTRPGLALMMVTLRDNTPPAAVPEQFYQTRKKLYDTMPLLPKGVQGPFVNDEYSDVDFAVYALDGHGLPERLLVRQAETVRQRLLHVPGVRKVDIVGERPEQIFVNFSNARLVTLGISAQDVFAALQRQNAVTAAGSIDTHGPQVFVRLDGALDDLEKIRDIPIAAGGRAFKISDIATVERGYEDPPTYLVRHSGQQTLILNVVMQDHWNGLKLGQSLAAAEKTLGAGLPVGVTLTKIVDQAGIIHAAVGEFMLKFFVALAVVMVVSLVSLGWRVGIVVAAAVPLTLSIVMVIMLVTGRALDRITLGALIISLGLLVDDAIIAIEMMVVKLEEGYERTKAAAYAWSHTAAPMLAGTLVTIIGFTPVGFARSTAGEYAGNIFWIVGYALLTSWFVAVVFTPYLGVKLLPDIKRVDGAYEHIYATPNYRRFRRLVVWVVRRKFMVGGAVLALFLLAFIGMGSVRQQFFPSSDRPELLAEVQMPEGTSIETTTRVTARVEAWLKTQPEARIVTSYVGAGAPRFFLAYNPELPDPSFAKIVVLTPSAQDRDRLRDRMRQAVAQGMAPEARIRVTQFVFGPYTHFPVMFRVMGPDVDRVRDIAAQLGTIMRNNPHTRDVNTDWGERVPTAHFVLDQDDHGTEDIDENLQPPQGHAGGRSGFGAGPCDAAPPAIVLRPAATRKNPGKANKALVPIFPVMVLLTLIVLVFETRSISGMFMVFLTAPLGLIGTVPTLLIFHQPFGFNAILGLIGLSGILMRNTLILIGQIKVNQAAGLDPFHAVVEATVQRARPVILTALAAVLAFIPLTESVFWGSLAYTLIGGTAAGTGLILMFLPALYAIWYRIRPEDEETMVATGPT